MQAGRTAHAQHPRRRAAVLCAAGICAEPCRNDVAVLIGCSFMSIQESPLRPLRNRLCHSIRLTGDKLTSLPQFFTRNDPWHYGVSRRARAAWGPRTKNYSILRIGNEYVVQA